MERLKTISDVMQTPANERINLVNFEDGTCPFCGSKLYTQVIGFGRHECEQYITCFCPTAQAAEEHNKRAENAKNNIAEPKKEDNASPMLTLTAADMFCVTMGQILPGVHPILADESVNSVLRIFGYKGSVKDKLASYAKDYGFASGLEKACKELEGWLYDAKISEFSDKVKELCAKYGIPKEITF